MEVDHSRRSRYRRNPSRVSAEPGAAEAGQEESHPKKVVLTQAKSTIMKVDFGSYEFATVTFRRRSAIFTNLLAHADRALEAERHGVRTLMAPATDPLSPENKLMFGTGPLTGTGAVAASRYVVVCKAPLTGTIACSNSGG